MRKHYYLGLNARRRGALRQFFAVGSWRDYQALEGALAKKYGGEAVLTKNGRTALMLALQRHCERGSGVIVNGFTCYAVVEAVRAAGCVPVYADINQETLNFTPETISKAILEHKVSISGIIVQNTLGIAVEMAEIEKFAKKHNLVIIEDLAHSVGVKYPDGREAGTVGAATVLSFGKDKAIDTVSGGAVIYRGEPKNTSSEGRDSSGLSSRASDPSYLGRNLRKPSDKVFLGSPSQRPRPSDYLRERCYPLLAAMVRGLTRVHLGGVLMRVLLKLRWVEKSADNRLDATRRMPKFEAKLALPQLERARGVQREFYLVHNRGECLKELKAAGYHFDGFWYERPVSPERYYKKAKFNEAKCPVATEVAAQIINLPTYYSKRDLIEARRIVQKYLIEKGVTENLKSKSARKGGQI